MAAGGSEEGTNGVNVGHRGCEKRDRRLRAAHTSVPRAGGQKCRNCDHCIDGRAGDCGETCRVRTKQGPLRAPGNGKHFIDETGWGAQNDRTMRGRGGWTDWKRTCAEWERETTVRLRVERRGGTLCGRRAREDAVPGNGRMS